MIWWIISLILILVIIAVSFFVVNTIKKRNSETEKRSQLYIAIKQLLDKKAMFDNIICIIDDHLTLAVNKSYTRMVAIKDFNPKVDTGYEIEDIAVQLLKKITKNKSSIQLDYIKNGEDKSILINKLDKKIEYFIYSIFKQKCNLKLQELVPNYKYEYIEGSDIECNYFWGYAPNGTILAYWNTNSKKEFGKINLLKENITLDIKYGYFEAPIMGINQQLFSYDNLFFEDIFKNLLKTIKQKTVKIKENGIYYDNYSNIVYLTNGINSLQVVLLNQAEEVFYTNNKIYFTLKKQDKIINFITNNDLINEFSEFVIGCNLRKIAVNFDYKTDKLINATESTKLIIDYSRLRVVYCANMDTLSKFSYIVISFDNIKEVSLEGKKAQPFVRIISNKNEAIDVTCNKVEVAEYAMALIKKIAQERA